jgi:hypothetical protein
VTEVQRAVGTGRKPENRAWLHRRAGVSKTSGRA